MTGRVTLTINVLCDHVGPLQPPKKTFRILLFFTTPSECVIGLNGIGFGRCLGGDLMCILVNVYWPVLLIPTFQGTEKRGG